jgi:glycosyltransferase involved in cell wall biosynthesis
LSLEHKAPLSTIILTFNEEINLPNSLNSVIHWADQVFVVDSFSTDKTIEIAKQNNVPVYENPWICWATQRNWALDNLPIRNEWVLFLDADEQISPELANEIKETLKNVPEEVAGFYINRRFIFLGRELKHGGYNPNWVLRLVRPRRTGVLPAGDSEYFQVNGQVNKLKSFMYHEDKKNIAFFIDKHNKISSSAAMKLFNKKSILDLEKEGRAVIEGRKRVWIKETILNKLPLFLRPFVLFTYRYFLKLGFLDGKEGFIYYFLHDFWYPFLVDVKVLELRKRNLPNQ